MSNDFGITETSKASSFDQRWMASNAGLALGHTHTLALSTIASSRNANGVLVSGIAVGRITAAGATQGFYGLFDTAATDGREILAGFILADINIVDAAGAVQASGKAPFSLGTRLDVKPAFLPIAAQRTINAATANTGQFVFVS